VHKEFHRAKNRLVFQNRQHVRKSKEIFTQDWPIAMLGLG
jgi:hypothetical protein